MENKNFSAATKMEFKLKAAHLIDLWRDFCEKHTLLYEFTCDEYIHLLSSDMDKLNETLEGKKELLEHINLLDAQRMSLTDEILVLMEIETPPKKLIFLLSFFKKNGEEDVANQIEKLNLVLLDIIEKIQEQNKKNQIFLNKAIHSLKELKQSFSGKTQYNTYSAAGITKPSNTL
jgi:flagellar biosynthesis/type III secretory pathway chaperone